MIQKSWCGTSCLQTYSYHDQKKIDNKASDALNYETVFFRILFGYIFINCLFLNT